MCKFFSGIIANKGKTALVDYWDDSHEKILKDNDIKDESVNPNFVRVELIPKDKNPCNQDIEQWELNVDQDYRPDWFDFTKAKKLMWERLNDMWKDCCIINTTVEELKDRKVRFVFSTKIKAMFDNSTVTEMWGNSTVTEMYGNSTVKKFSTKSKIKAMLGLSVCLDFSEEKAKIITNGNFEIRKKE